MCKVNVPPELGCNALFCRNCRPAFALRYSTGSDPVVQHLLSSAWKPAVSSIHRSRYESMLSEVVVPAPSDRVSQNPAVSAYIMTKVLRYNAIRSCVSNAENYRKPIEYRILRNSSSATVFLHQAQPISCRAHQRQNYKLSAAGPLITVYMGHYQRLYH